MYSHIQQPPTPRALAIETTFEIGMGLMCTYLIYCCYLALPNYHYCCLFRMPETCRFVWYCQKCVNSVFVSTLVLIFLLCFHIYNLPSRKILTDEQLLFRTQMEQPVYRGMFCLRRHLAYLSLHLGRWDTSKEHLHVSPPKRQFLAEISFDCWLPQ